MTPNIFELSRLGFKLFATPDTSDFLTSRGIKNEVIARMFELLGVGASRVCETEYPLLPPLCTHCSTNAPSSQKVSYPASDSAADLAASPLMRLIKDNTVDLVINSTPAGRTKQPRECLLDETRNERAHACPPRRALNPFPACLSRVSLRSPQLPRASRCC